MSDILEWIIALIIVLAIFISLLHSCFADFANHPTVKLSANDVIDGYIVIAIVDDFHVFAEKPNDNTCYLLTISEKFSELSFVEQLKVCGNKPIYVSDSKVAFYDDIASK